MSPNWDLARSTDYLRRLREEIETFGEPLASNIDLDSIDPANLREAGSAGLIITEDEHLVFVRRTDLPDGGDWLLTPGGATEPGESPGETFVREVREETGFDVEIDTLAIIYAVSGADEPEWRNEQLWLIVLYIGYARGGRINDCVDREDDIREAVAIRCDEVDLEQILYVTDKLLVNFTACGPPEVTKAELMAQFAQLGQKWPPRLGQ